MGFAVDCYGLEEKILLYSMFTRYAHPQGLKILQEYLGQGGREQVILAYLTFESYDYFIGEEEKDGFLFEALEKILEKGWECDIICRLALLKAYTESGQWDEKRMHRAVQILEECVQERLKFAFFQDMPKELLQVCQLEDKVFVQCKAGPNAKVTLHYQIERENVLSEEKTEPMKERYQGIYNKEFVLFYGEKLITYFVIEKENRIETTAKQVLQIEKNSFQGRSKYQMLNAMLQMKEQGNIQELCLAEESYLRQEQQVWQLFPLLD